MGEKDSEILSGIHMGSGLLSEYRYDIGTHRLKAIHRKNQVHIEK